MQGAERRRRLRVAGMGRKRPRGRVRRAGKRAKADSAHDVYVVGCVLEELTREVEALDELLPPVSCCAACDDVLPPCECPSDEDDLDLEPQARCWVCRATWASCSACARDNAACVGQLLERGGRRLRRMARERVQEGLREDPWRSPVLPRPPWPCSCLCCRLATRPSSVALVDVSCGDALCCARHLWPNSRARRVWRHKRALAERLPLSDSDEDFCTSGGPGVCGVVGGGWGRRRAADGDCDPFDSDDGVDDAQAEEDDFLAAFFEREEAGFDILADADA